MAANFTEDNEWEVFTKGDFICKRLKHDPSAASSSSSFPPPTTAPSDPELEHKNRRIRKKSTLLKIRESYQKELLQWEHLSNTLCAFQQNSSNLQPEPPRMHGDPSSAGQSSSENLPLSTCRDLIDELLLQADAQEAVIEDAVNQCEIAEAVVKKKEKQFQLKFSALPVWKSSPRALILSLCDD